MRGVSLEVSARDWKQGMPLREGSGGSGRRRSGGDVVISRTLFGMSSFLLICAFVTPMKSHMFFKKEEIGPLTGANIFEMSVCDVHNDLTWTPT